MSWQEGLGRRLARRGLRWLGRRLGYDVVLRSPYSPIPSVPAAGDASWTQGSAMPGVALDLEAQLAILGGPLAGFLRELEGLLESPPEGWRFDPANGYFQGADAAVLWAMLRRSRPRRVIEVGAGMSTVIAAAALARNAAEGSACRLVAVDPAPRLDGLAGLDGLAELRVCSATEVTLDEYLELEAGDILLVDSSHTVKRGSEVNFLVLEVLPRLRPGVRVHFHDVFLPFDYPREWFERGTFLAEQYLLHAFLVDNPAWEVELALQAMWRAAPERFTALVRVPESHPFGRSSLWMRRRK